MASGDGVGCTGRDVRHVRHPQPIGRVGEEPPLHQIDRFFRLRIALRRHHVLAQRGASDAVPAHQASHALATYADAAVRPDRANATICRLNSGVYRTVLSAIVNSSCYNGEVSTKPGQLQ